MNAIPSNCIVTKLDRQQMQGNDVMRLLYFDINLYHLRTNTNIIDRDDNWNLLLYKEAYHIKRSTPFLNNGLKASRELRLFSWQFRFFVFHFHVVMLLYNLAVFKSLLPVSRLVRRWYRFISKYNNLITLFPCICCLSSLVTMQLLGIAFILNENNLESKLNWYFKCLVLMPATFRTSMQSLTVFAYNNLIMPFSK